MKKISQIFYTLILCGITSAYPNQVKGKEPYIEQFIGQKISYDLEQKHIDAYEKKVATQPEKAYAALEKAWINHKRAQLSSKSSKEIFYILLSELSAGLWFFVIYQIPYKFLFSEGEITLSFIPGTPTIDSLNKLIAEKGIISSLYDKTLLAQNKQLEQFIKGTILFFCSVVGLSLWTFFKPIAAFSGAPSRAFANKIPNLNLPYYLNLLLNFVIQWLNEWLVNQLKDFFFWFYYQTALLFALIKLKFHNRINRYEFSSDLFVMELSYFIHKQYLSKEVKKQIIRYLRQAQRSEMPYQAIYLKKAQALLALPNQRRFEVAVNSSFLLKALQTYGHMKLEKKEDLDPFQQKLYIGVKNQADLLRAAVHDKKTTNRPKKRQYMYFTNPKGFTGKSYFANHILPKAIEVTDLKTKKKAHLGYITCDVKAFFENNPSSKKQPSVWLQKLMQYHINGYEHPVVLSITGLQALLEDPDLQSQVHAFFSTPKPSYYDPWLERLIPLPEIILFTARKPIPKTTDQALFEEVQFPGFTKDAKQHIFETQMLYDLMKAHGIKQPPEKYFTPKQYKALLEIPRKDSYKDLKAIYEEADAYIKELILMKTEEL